MRVTGTQVVSPGPSNYFHLFKNQKIHVFCNHTQMVSNSLNAAGVSPFVEGQHLTDNVKRYKPSPAVYQDLLKSLGKTKEPQNVWLVSGYVQLTTAHLYCTISFT